MSRSVAWEESIVSVRREAAKNARIEVKIQGLYDSDVNPNHNPDSRLL